MCILCCFYCSLGVLYGYLVKHDGITTIFANLALWPQQCRLCAYLVSTTPHNLITTRNTCKLATTQKNNRDSTTRHLLYKETQMNHNCSQLFAAKVCASTEGVINQGVNLVTRQNSTRPQRTIISTAVQPVLLLRLWPKQGARHVSALLH